MATTREDVIKAFPELATPGFPDPDHPQRTSEDCIAGWITYWDGMAQVLRTKH